MTTIADAVRAYLAQSSSDDGDLWTLQDRRDDMRAALAAHDAAACDGIADPGALLDGAAMIEAAQPDDADAWRDAARDEYATDELAIYDDARVEVVDGGAWVEAWAYVYAEGDA